jgi:hypothetical protein
MTAFVLGNGVSRADIDVAALQVAGSVYGCNALYRTHAVTALVATDRPIAEEIERSGYPRQHTFYTRRPRPDSGAHRVPEQYFGYSSGPIATALAAQDGHAEIYLLGFDMGPGQDGRFNNVYADTQFYKPLGSTPTYAGNWARQMARVIRDHANQRFVRVHGATTHPVPEFDRLANLVTVPLEEFRTWLNTPKE